MHQRFSSSFILYPLVLILFFVTNVSAERFDHWQWINPLPQGNTLYSISHGNNTFVAVGRKGTIVTSIDGYTWQTRNTNFRESLYATTYGTGLFVAVGETGTIVTSPDGVHWTAQESGTNHDLQEIVYGDNKFIAVGDNGVICTSINGVEWVVRESGTVADIVCIARGNGTFVAGGGAHTLTSSDGVTWIVSEAAVNSSYYSLHSIVWVDDAFTAAGNWHCSGWCSGVPGTSILSSPDGIVWTAKAGLPYRSVNELIHGDDLFVAVGNGGSSIYTSPDGNTWPEMEFVVFPENTEEPTPVLQGIVYGDGTWVAVGEKGGIMVSSDGVAWVKGENTIIRRDAGLTDIAYGNTGFVAVGGQGIIADFAYEDLDPLEYGYVPILTSPGGLQWTAQNSGVSNTFLNAISYGSNIYVSVGKNGIILSSTDGAVWTPRFSGTELTINVIAYGNNIFVAVGNGRVALTSPDGINWSKIVSEHIRTPNDISFGRGIFVAVGSNGMIITSSDGIEWTRRILGTTSELIGVSFNNDLFVTVGRNGVIFTSPDGIIWTERFSGITEDLLGVDFGENAFVAWGRTNSFINHGVFMDESIVLTSEDGIAWTLKNTPNLHLCGVAYGGGSLITVGCNTEILRADGLDLLDAILALQLLTGKVQSQMAYNYADINDDGVIDLQDAISIMQTIGDEW